MTISPFAPILEAACTRHGAQAMEARLPQPKTPAELAAIGADRYLSQMSLRIFRAGLKHSLVDAKWPAFEEVFHGFDLRRVRAMSDEALEGLLGNARLIRHWGKRWNSKISYLDQFFCDRLVVSVCDESSRYH
jgi:3-methyladenine DNA glycosylase Tag